MSDQKEIVDRKVNNTGQISFLKARKYAYSTNKKLSKDGKKIVEYIFKIPKNEVNIVKNYWHGEFVSAIDFKRELDSTRQEIEDMKNNWELED